MATRIDEQRLETLLAALEAARPWSPRLVSKLEVLIRAGSEEELFRINPLRFAAERGLAPDETIDLFLHAAALGLFQMDWLLLCPICSCVVESLSSLTGVTSGYHCKLCHADHATALDAFVAVKFTVAPDIRALAYHQPAELPVHDYCFRYRLSEDGLGPSGVPMVQTMQAGLKALSYLPAGTTTQVAFAAERGPLFVFDADSEAGFELAVTGAPVTEPQRLAVLSTGSALTPATSEVAPGPVTMAVTNTDHRRGMVGVVVLPPDYEHAPLRFAPFLSGKDLLNSRTFRELFRSELIRGTEGLGVRDLTVLFTDLAGSTALYARIGDLNAFALVQQHFDALERITAAHRGAVVKTIGDAVMASFPTPAEAMHAALDMLAATDRLNAGPYGRAVVLKIGVHRGAVIAVTLNERLDYFGQTVNIAARLQDSAGPDEICLSAPVHDYPGVAELLAACRVNSETSRFRGMDHEMPAFRVCRPAPAA